MNGISSPFLRTSVLLLGSLGVALISATLPAQAACLTTSSECFFSFEGINQDGTGSGLVKFSGLNTTTVTVEIENTSPLTFLRNGSAVDFNYATILSVGFDAANATAPGVKGWKLEANRYDSETFASQALGSGGTLATTDNSQWILRLLDENLNEIVDSQVSRRGKDKANDLFIDTQGEGIFGTARGYIIDNGNGVREGFYNPEGVTSNPAIRNRNWTDSLKTRSNPFFAKAILTLEFDNPFQLLATDAVDECEGNPFLYLQRVGKWHDTLTLCGLDITPDSSVISENDGEPLTPQSVPEPSLLGGLSAVLACLGIRRLRRLRNP